MAIPPKARTHRDSWPLPLFPPGYFALMLGQITPLILVGLTSLSLRREKTQWVCRGRFCSTDLVKAAALLSISIVAIAVVLVWQHRLWRVILGASIAGLAVTLIPALFNPGIYASYITLCTTSGLTTPLDWAAPALGNALRVWISPDWSVLEFAPIAVGAAWLVYYWQRHQRSWNWTERLPIYC